MFLKQILFFTQAYHLGGNTDSSIVWSKFSNKAVDISPIACSSFGVYVAVRNVGWLPLVRELRIWRNSGNLLRVAILAGGEGEKGSFGGFN